MLVYFSQPSYFNARSSAFSRFWYLQVFAGVFSLLVLHFKSQRDVMLQVVLFRRTCCLHCKLYSTPSAAGIYHYGRCQPDANAIAVISRRLLRLLFNSPSPSSSSSPSPSLPLLLSQSLFFITEVGSRVVQTRTMKQCLKRNLAHTILKSGLKAS